jgi:type II secretory ATPase GspE/PulE/Tfp pilus assembly ATPase PilB-like protein
MSSVHPTHSSHPPKRLSPRPPKPTSGGARRRKRLGELLVASGTIEQVQLNLALEEQRRHKGRRLGEILVSRGYVSEHDLAQALAREFELPFVDLATYPLNAAALTALPAAIVLKYHVLPIDFSGEALVVALGDPLAFDALDAVRLNTPHALRQVVSMPSQLEARIGALLQSNASTASGPAGIDAILRELGETDPKAAIEAEPATETDAAVVRLVNQILVDAFRRGASDIHIEPNGPHAPMIVRFRVDGECSAYHELSGRLGPPVVARVKIMSDLDIAERRKPQDGKVRFLIGTTPLELRVATLPTVGGNEDVVLRLLPAAKPRPLEQMALSSRNLRELKTLLAKPYGLLLCVGPTGSGKTTTLHSALGSINTVDMKIWTAEEPVEITQPGLRQVQVNRKIGLDFAAAMRSFLRADPDVIMVGEMRDKETSLVAVEASLTGHLVLSTLHTNSAPDTVVRLLDMGLDPFGFADSLLGVLAQRLVRGLCPECRQAGAPTPTEMDAMVGAFGGPDAFAQRFDLDRADQVAVWAAVGCESCEGTGYQSRIALHELLVADDALRAAIARRASIDEIRALASRGGMGTLLQDGVEKAVLGDTDMRQVLAACSR